MRAVPLGIGAITPAKTARLLELRGLVLELMRRMAQACFVPEPLNGTRTKDEIEAKLVIMQSASTINAVWAEQARMRVQPALDEAVNRYFKSLIGILRFVDQLIPKSKSKTETTLDKVGKPVIQRTFYNVPVEIQDAIAIDELAALKAIAEE